MKLKGNTILITGGGSGIGRGLAEALQAEGNKVIIAGRRKVALEEVVAANPHISAVVFDIDDAEGIKSFASQLIKDFPELNVLINNAGIMRPEDLLDERHLATAEAIISTNLLGPIRLTTALMAQLQKQPYSTIINVTSGLAFVPLAVTPTYSATKAAMHSYCDSLRYQLREKNIQVIEIAPPGVQTDLMGAADNPRMMPLKDFIAETMDLLKSEPDGPENLVENVKFLRFAERAGKYDEAFEVLNPAD